MARTRVKIYDNENQDQDISFKIEVEEHKQNNITYHQQTTKHSEINNHSD